MGGLLVGLFLGELAARVIRPAGNSDLLFNSPDASPPGLYQRDAELLLVPTPGFQATARSLGYAVPIRINRLGMRGPEPEAVADVARWLTIGDSFTFSIQVPEEQTFIGHLSAERKEHFWNAGVDGYSTWQALDRYKGLRSSSGSSAVLLLFFLGNDLQDNERWPIQKAEMDRPPPAPPGGATHTAGGPPRPPEIRQGPPRSSGGSPSSSKTPTSMLTCAYGVGRGSSPPVETRPSSVGGMSSRSTPAAGPPASPR